MALVCFRDEPFYDDCLKVNNHMRNKMLKGPSPIFTWRLNLFRAFTIYGHPLWKRLKEETMIGSKEEFLTGFCAKKYFKKVFAILSAPIINKELFVPVFNDTLTERMTLINKYDKYLYREERRYVQKNKVQNSFVNFKFINSIDFDDITFCHADDEDDDDDDDDSSDDRPKRQKLIKFSDVLKRMNKEKLEMEKKEEEEKQESYSYKKDEANEDIEGGKIYIKKKTHNSSFEELEEFTQKLNSIVIQHDKAIFDMKQKIKQQELDRIKAEEEELRRKQQEEEEKRKQEEVDPFKDIPTESIQQSTSLKFMKRGSNYCGKMISLPTIKKMIKSNKRPYLSKILIGEENESKTKFKDYKTFVENKKEKEVAKSLFAINFANRISHIIHKSYCSTKKLPNTTMNSTTPKIDFSPTKYFNTLPTEASIRYSPKKKKIMKLKILKVKVERDKLSDRKVLPKIATHTLNQEFIRNSIDFKKLRLKLQITPSNKKKT